MGKIPLLISSLFLLLSLLWFLLFSKSRNIKESALIHIVERVTSKEIKTDTLTDELKNILIERDNIIEDRFDDIIKNADIFDLKGEITQKELFSIIAESLSKKTGIDKTFLYNLLIEREKESTTAIHPGLAIPHIIIPGEKRFEIVLVRSKQGIIFNQDIPSVNIVFALAGTKDERHFHLQALMAIAQIVQDKNFKKSWMKAKTTKELRNIILLTQRVRKGNI
jgi:mannitol/fructose-specific phosphotransferase system IIA component (Ntr-type)